jgi:hypothetical protein
VRAGEWRLDGYRPLPNRRRAGHSLSGRPLAPQASINAAARSAPMISALVPDCADISKIVLLRRSAAS